MRIRQIHPEELQRIREPVIRIMKKHGDGRITHRALRWLNRLDPREVPEGTYIAAAMDGNRVIGLIVFGKFGVEESFIAVHPDHRKQGVGEALLNNAINHLKKVYTRVATDNIPSLRLCFSCGLVAFRLTHGPTGKPTLWLGGGDFRQEDIPHEKKMKPSP
jgi:GNAT superfamily N-acetyltransferase